MPVRVKPRDRLPWFEDGQRLPPRGQGRVPANIVEELAGSKWRLPPDAPEEVKAAASAALQQMVRAMNGEFPPQMAAAVVAAAKAVRDDICGPAAKTLNVNGKIGVSAILAAMEEAEDKAKVIDVTPVPKALPENSDE